MEFKITWQLFSLMTRCGILRFHSYRSKVSVMQLDKLSLGNLVVFNHLLKRICLPIFKFDGCFQKAWPESAIRFCDFLTKRICESIDVSMDDDTCMASETADKVWIQNSFLAICFF